LHKNEGPKIILQIIYFKLARGLTMCFNPIYERQT